LALQNDIAIEKTQLLHDIRLQRQRNESQQQLSHTNTNVTSFTSVAAQGHVPTGLTSYRPPERWQRAETLPRSLAPRNGVHDDDSQVQLRNVQQQLLTTIDTQRAALDEARAKLTQNGMVTPSVVTTRPPTPTRTTATANGQQPSVSSRPSSSTVMIGDSSSQSSINTTRAHHGSTSSLTDSRPTTPSSSVSTTTGTVNGRMERELRGLRSVRDLTSLFRNYDLNCDGTVTHGEFKRALRHAGVVVSETTLNSLINHLDPNSSGDVAYMQLAQTPELRLLPSNQHELQMARARTRTEELARPPGFRQRDNFLGPTQLTENPVAADAFERRRGQFKHAPPLNDDFPSPPPENGGAPSDIPSTQVNTAMSYIARKVEPGRMNAALTAVDLDGDGMVNHSQLKMALTRLNLQVSPDVLSSIITTFDPNRSGMIDKRQFADHISRAHPVSVYPPSAAIDGRLRPVDIATVDVPLLQSDTESTFDDSAAVADAVQWSKKPSMTAGKRPHELPPAGMASHWAEQKRSMYESSGAAAAFNSSQSQGPIHHSLEQFVTSTQHPLAHAYATESGPVEDWQFPEGPVARRPQQQQQPLPQQRRPSTSSITSSDSRPLPSRVNPADERPLPITSHDFSNNDYNIGKEPSPRPSASPRPPSSLAPIDPNAPVFEPATPLGASTSSIAPTTTVAAASKAELRQRAHELPSAGTRTRYDGVDILGRSLPSATNNDDINNGYYTSRRSSSRPPSPLPTPRATLTNAAKVAQSPRRDSSAGTNNTAPAATTALPTSKNPITTVQASNVSSAAPYATIVPGSAADVAFSSWGHKHQPSHHLLPTAGAPTSFIPKSHRRSFDLPLKDVSSLVQRRPPSPIVPHPDLVPPLPNGGVTPRPRSPSSAVVAADHVVASIAPRDGGRRHSISSNHSNGYLLTEALDRAMAAGTVRPPSPSPLPLPLQRRSSSVSSLHVNVPQSGATTPRDVSSSRRHSFSTSSIAPSSASSTNTTAYQPAPTNVVPQVAAGLPSPRVGVGIGMHARARSGSFSGSGPLNLHAHQWQMG
jgi:Ca2+-binding EF-hand superfamily protein